MRTLLAGERDLLAGARYGIQLRVEVTDAGGDWIDLSDLSGVDWVREVSWGDTLDQAVMSGTVVLHREVGTSSIAPLLEASLLNRDDASAYAPLLHANRRIRISTACIASSASPVSGDWREVFLGKIDDVDSGRGETVALAIRDEGAYLLNTQIETEQDYGSPGGTAVETVMQSILDDNATGVTLYVPTSPAWAVTEFTQAADTNVFEALRALALQFGWDVRYRYDASHVFRLTLWEPVRSGAAVATSFTADEYLAVRSLNISDADIRNVVQVGYPGGTVERTHAASIAIYGRRLLVIGSGTAANIDTQAEAEGLADAALADLALPAVTKQIENLYWWPVQLGDLYTWTANGVHYDTDQDLAVVGYTHRLSGGSGRTTMDVRGQPSGAFRRWLSGESTGIGQVAEVSAFDYRVNPLTGIAEVFGTVNDICQSFEWWLDPVFEPSDPTAGSPALVDGLSTEKRFSFTFSLPDGKATTLTIQPFGQAAAAGDAGLTYVTPVARSPRTTVSFQPRDPSGRVSSEWAQVSFGVRPTIPVHPTGGGGTISGTTASSLSDSGAAWTPDEFAYDANARVFFYVRAGGQVARILSNTATTLTIAPEWEPEPTGTYQIYQGATLYKVSEAEGGFIPVTAPVHLQRGAADIVLEFYSEINGTVPEPVNRFTIDADDTPELEGLDVEEIQANEIRWGPRGIDDDVKRVVTYVKKGGWPTLDGLEGGAFDPEFLRNDAVVAEAAFVMSAGDGTWYGLAVPVNSYNDLGPRVSASIVVAGAPVDPRFLQNIVLEKIVNAGEVYYRIRWAHSAALESPDTTSELRIYGYRADEGVGLRRLLSPVSRRAWQDSDAGFDADPSTDAEVTPGVGSLQLEAGTDGSDITRTWYFDVELWEGGVRQVTYSVSRSDTFGLNLPSGFSLVDQVPSEYGGKTYVTAVFAYTANEQPSGAVTELWEQVNNNIFDAGVANRIVAVPAGKPLKKLRLQETDGDLWYYWLRNTTPDGSAFTAMVGPVEVDYTGVI